MNEYVEYLKEQLEGLCPESSFRWEYTVKGCGVLSFEETFEDFDVNIYSGLGDADSYGFGLNLKSKEQVDALLIGLGIKE